MKRAVISVTVLALIIACCFAAYPRSSNVASTTTEKMTAAIEKVKGLLPVSKGEGDQTSSSDGADFSVRSLDISSFDSGVLNSTEDVVLVPTDEYSQGYVFNYDGSEFTAIFNGFSWKVCNSYKITNHNDILMICQALLNEHPVYGSDWESFRTAEDMAFEWEQHNLAYELLPDDSHWREDAKDADLDPDDQGKNFIEMYERRTGKKIDISNYLPK